MTANGLGNWGSIPGRFIPKTQKMVLDTFLLNAQNYKIWIKSKWSNPGKRVVPSQHLSVVAIEKRAFRSPSTMVGQLICSVLHPMENFRTLPQWLSWIWHLTIWWWGSSYAEALGNMEYPTAIAPMSTLTRSGSIW